MRKKILTITPSAFPGVTAVFKHLEALELSRHMPLESVQLPIKDYDLVIFGGWTPQYNMILDQVKAERWVLWTSPLLQTDLNSPESEFLMYVLREDRITKVWAGSRELQGIHPKVEYIPYPVHVESITKHRKEVERDSMFLCSVTRPDKNILNQLVAAKQIQKKYPDLTLQCNLTPQYKRFADMLGIKYLHQGWVGRDEYYANLNRSKLLLHVSLTESMAYQVMEAMLLGCPALVSPTVDWMYYNTRVDKLILDVYDRPDVIAKRAIEVLEGAESEICMKVAEDEAKRRNAKVTKVLSNL